MPGERGQAERRLPEDQPDRLLLGTRPKYIDLGDKRICVAARKRRDDGRYFNFKNIANALLVWYDDTGKKGTMDFDTCSSTELIALYDGARGPKACFECRDSAELDEWYNHIKWVVHHEAVDNLMLETFNEGGVPAVLQSTALQQLAALPSAQPAIQANHVDTVPAAAAAAAAAAPVDDAASHTSRRSSLSLAAGMLIMPAFRGIGSNEAIDKRVAELVGSRSNNKKAFKGKGEAVAARASSVGEDWDTLCAEATSVRLSAEDTQKAAAVAASRGESWDDLGRQTA
ncbi:unnamed protein product [Vitrella brassicaformis CCMP3155]|uniref:PH domain-containing protein n=1 Tax=Vitrella brassicaformis (strain CCMP3155) TaxID=1169540 RepID=A0A0G4E9L2_VITBC|nr:unnamed protein product [Vitrella brassicaformis CCMP3155]|eukprot:CEL92584.1 unnamed protein product [Vitrella brassicaformis CCMP3155]